jgi:hypothetical protein
MDNYSDHHVLGCGGHGMIYKGLLDDGIEVAIKKSKVIDDESTTTTTTKPFSPKQVGVG